MSASTETPQLDAELLFTLRLEEVEDRVAGTTPRGERHIVTIDGGSFEGPDLRGQVMPGGSDWQSWRVDGSATMNCRLTLRTDDGHTFGFRIRGALDGPSDVLERYARGETVEGAEFYLRFVGFFEAAWNKYSWLNHLVAVGVGHREAAGLVYDVYRVL